MTERRPLSKAPVNRGSSSVNLVDEMFKFDLHGKEAFYCLYVCLRPFQREPHVDLNWYLQSTPGEPEIQLTRTIRNVLACRYRPARLDVATMAEQLKEAEVYLDTLF